MRDSSFFMAFVTWLLLVWMLQRLLPLRGRPALLLAGFCAALLLFIPWFGHPLPYWSFGLSPNFSVVMAALLLLSVAGRSSGRTILRARDWSAAWIFGAIASVALYPSALGAGPQCLDAYALGWPWLFPMPSLAFFGGIALVSATLLWRGNRFGYVLLAALLAYPVGLQPSENLWDYLIDPVYASTSLLAMLRVIWCRFRR